MLIDGAIKRYDWGSKTTIPKMFGWTPTTQPVAEVWFGAHQQGPASLRHNQISLRQHIASNPTHALGETAARRFTSVPFLLKVLAAAKPLSLQTHPNSSQAQRGFQREEALGVDRHAPNRNFSDPHHKPELICALSSFTALCGLRDPGFTLDLLATIGTQELDHIRQSLNTDPSPKGIHNLLELLFAQDQEITTRQITRLVEACEAKSVLPFAMERKLLAHLGKLYPQDPAVLVAVLLNLIVLQPNEALFLPAGNLHAYIDGCGVEIMANSDNVVRAGFTNKHVAPQTLLDIVDTTPLTVAVQNPDLVAGVAQYHSPVEEFSLQRIELNNTKEIDIGSGPAIILNISGSAQLHYQSNEDQLFSGDAAWLDAASGKARLKGTAKVFVAKLGTLSPN